jgi:LysM repeat protein
VNSRRVVSVVALSGLISLISACGGDDATVPETLPVLVAESTTTIPLETTSTLAANPEFYTIQQGDTLSAIAASFGVTVADIVAANGLPNADAIQAGQKLAIPGNGTAPTTTAVATTTVATNGSSTTMAP